MLSLPAISMRAVLLVILVGTGACDSSRFVSPGEITRFLEAESKWRARPFSDHRYEIRTACFCPPEINRWTRVTVRDGVVIAAEAVEPHPAFPITSIDLWTPIDSIFVELGRMLQSGFGDSDSPYEAIVATYDPLLGFPTLIDYRTKSNIADGGMTRHIRNVTSLDGLQRVVHSVGQDGTEGSGRGRP